MGLCLKIPILPTTFLNWEIGADRRLFPQIGSAGVKWVTLGKMGK